MVCSILGVCKLEPNSQLVVADLLPDFGSRIVAGLTHLTMQQVLLYHWQGFNLD